MGLVSSHSLKDASKKKEVSLREMITMLDQLKEKERYFFFKEVSSLFS
jgi:hypothetical protein